MKLVRFGSKGKEKPGMLDGSGRVRSLEGRVPDIDPTVLARLDMLRAIDPEYSAGRRRSPAGGARRPDVGKFALHRAQLLRSCGGNAAPSPPEPILFTKATCAIIGPNDDSCSRRGSTKTDWEVELGVVIGNGRAIRDRREAVLDACRRRLRRQRRLRTRIPARARRPWDKGKGCDTFGPIGPWLVTADEVGDVGDLDLWLEVNGRSGRPATRRA